MLACKKEEGTNQISGWGLNNVIIIYKAVSHLPTTSPAIDDLVTGRLSPLIIPPVVITKYIDCVKNHLRFF